VEGELGKGEDADVCFDGWDCAGNIPSVDSFGGLVVEEGVEGGGSMGTSAARQVGGVSGGAAEDVEAVFLGAGGVDGGDQNGGGEGG
jgi:hypothetical protein